MCTMSLVPKMALVAIVAATVQSALAVLPIEHWTATTGAYVYFVPNPSVLMLNINLSVGADSRYELAAEVDLASLTAGTLNGGATAWGNAPTRDEAAIADAFADVGVSFSGGAGGDRTSLRLHTLSDPVEHGPAIMLMMQIISTPTFPDTVLAHGRQRLVVAIREPSTKPSVLVECALGKVICNTHPYGQTAAPEAAKSIARDDIARYYRANYTVKRAVVTLIGAISRQGAEAIAEQITRDLSVGGVTPPTPPDVEMPLAKTGAIRISHPAQQTTIILGQPGTVRGGKDYFPLLVGNCMLDGGGLSMRLTNEVCEERSLTYSIDGYFTPVAQSDPFELALQTHKDQTEEALGMVRDTVVKFAADGSTSVELKAVKDNLVNGFPLRLDNNRKLLDNVANTGWYNLPLSYLDTWTQHITAVMCDQMRTALQRVLQPQIMAAIVAGGLEKAAAN